MAIGWYYAHDEKKLGPFSQEQLKDLAARGEILLTDTVWKEGVEQGAAAGRIKNLFTPANVQTVAPNSVAMDALPGSAVTASPTSVAPVSAAPKTEPAKTPAASPAKAEPKMEKRGTATALKGAVLAGQDGVQARYRMKCLECGHLDASCRMIKITNKTTKSGFFCPKCKKQREVVIQCRLS